MVTNSQTQGRKTPKSQIYCIRIWHQQRFTVPEIQRKLRESFGDEARGRRTVYGIIKDTDTNNTPWYRLGTDGDDVRLISEAMAEVTKRSEGRKTEPTQEEVEWLIWVCKRVPTLPPYYQWVMATLYRLESVKKEPDNTQFEAFLNLKPWESIKAMLNYDDRCLRGEIPQGNFMIDIAMLARGEAYKKENDQELLELEQLAIKGDPDAVFGLSLLEHSDVGILLERQRKQAEAWREAVANVPPDEWPIDANSWVAQYFPEGLSLSSHESHPFLETVYIDDTEGGDAIET